MEGGENAAALLQGERKPAAHTAANPHAFLGVFSPPGSIHQAQPPAPCQCVKELLPATGLILLPWPRVLEKLTELHEKERAQALGAKESTGTENLRQTPQLRETATRIPSVCLDHFL